MAKKQKRDFNFDTLCVHAGHDVIETNTITPPIYQSVAYPFKSAEYAAQLFSTFKNYDVYIEESHHKMKKDAPSGTALILKNLVQKSYPGQELPVSSTRAGYIPGIHSMNFDSSVDSVHIQHIARSRMGFAEGALMAVKWIHKKTGIYAFNLVGRLHLINLAKAIDNTITAR